MTIQEHNQENIDLLGVSLQKRYEANFALGNISSLLYGIPGLRGAWMASSFDDGGDMFDLSEQDRVLTYNGAPEFNYQGLAPYVWFDGTNDYFERADEAGLDITGLETFIDAGKRGFSFGGWFYFDDLTGRKNLMSKWLSANDLSYVLYITNAQVPTFAITSGGTIATVNVVSSSSTVAVDTWYFIAGTYDPSTSTNIYVNKVNDSNAVAVPASIYSGAANFQIGGIDGGANRLFGRYSFGFLSSMFLSDSVINNLFQQSRALFGV